MPSLPPLTRVAILGGGMAALSTAAQLAQQQHADGTPVYDITIYQLGWRVGGKGASGRNRDPGMGMRIEEHGLHVWFGCYHEAWKLLKSCYDALGRPDDVQKLFQGQTNTPYMEDVNGWMIWPVFFPRKYGTLGSGTSTDDVVQYSSEIGQFLLTTSANYASQLKPRSSAAHGDPSDAPVNPPGDPDDPNEELLRRIGVLRAELGVTAIQGDDGKKYRAVIAAAEPIRALIYGDGTSLSGLPDILRRLGIMFDLALAAIRGLWDDDVLRNGFDSLDKEDARAWFSRHGAAQESLESAPIRALYDLCFAYRGGRVGWDQADFAAGAALVTVLRISCEYADYVTYEMRAGMGEVVIAPIYQFLKLKGVHFKFFHQIDRLELDDDAKQVVAVHMTEQAKVIGDVEYDPLFKLDLPTVDGISSLQCWPNEPKYELLQDGDALRAFNLESRWSGWPGVGPATIRAGDDYDLLVLGVSLESAKEVCADFSERVPGWKAMFDAMASVQTVSAQLWMTRSLEGLGWTDGAVPVDAAPEPLDVWADRTDLLQRECWTDAPPKSLHYLCGPLDESWAAGVPRDPTFPIAGKAAALRTTSHWLEQYASAIWSESSSNGAFDWSLLRDPTPAIGPERLLSQYVRANIDPSERYVLSVANSTVTRLTADGSGLGNLILTGDWTRSAWNAGCIESAVSTGVNAASAIGAAAARMRPLDR
jgi:uncharacterized protein with NAD-binding domain and iron-sulfur cluster